MKHWEIIADNISKAGWSWGCVSAIDSNGRTIWIADAHRDDGKHFVHRVSNWVADRIRAPVPQRAEGQHIGIRSTPRLSLRGRTSYYVHGMLQRLASDIAD